MAADLAIALAGRIMGFPSWGKGKCRVRRVSVLEHLEGVEWEKSRRSCCRPMIRLRMQVRLGFGARIENLPNAWVDSLWEHISSRLRWACDRMIGFPSPIAPKAKQSRSCSMPPALPSPANAMGIRPCPKAMPSDVLLSRGLRYPASPGRCSCPNSSDCGFAPTALCRGLPWRSRNAATIPASIASMPRETNTEDVSFRYLR